MTKTNITRSWREQKVMLKRRFSVLSDIYFDFKDEQKETMFDNLEIKLEKTEQRWNCFLLNSKPIER